MIPAEPYQPLVLCEEGHYAINLIMIIYWQYLGMKTATPTLANGFVPVPAIVSVYSEIVLQTS